MISESLSSIWKPLQTAGAGDLNSTKTRVDHAPLNGTGIHPLPPGAPATGSQVGTQGAPKSEIGD
jgi:hypothetical protein